MKRAGVGGGNDGVREDLLGPDGAVRVEAEREGDGDGEADWLRASKARTASFTELMKCARQRRSIGGAMSNPIHTNTAALLLTLRRSENTSILTSTITYSVLQGTLETRTINSGMIN